MNIKDLLSAISDSNMEKATKGMINLLIDQAISYGDIVARLEAEIAALKLQSFDQRRTLSHRERKQLIDDINQLLQILNGDKPDDSKIK